MLVSLTAAEETNRRDLTLRRRPFADLRRHRGMSNPTANTELLRAAKAGDRRAFDQIFALIYDELKQAAHQRLVRDRAREVLNTTALVHEAYLRLVDQSRLQWEDRGHFLALASRAMRYVIIDHIRARGAKKRGGGEVEIPLDAVEVAAETCADNLLYLNDALERLAEFSPRLAQLVDYRYFGGLSNEEIGEIMDISVSTVKRDWIRARAWLFRAMQEDAGRVEEGS
jgi:RNA polymerase sigma factor (TIGR02999 family)